MSPERDLWILFIDIRDERTDSDHMHAWGTYEEVSAIQRDLIDKFGQRAHRIIDGYVCPWCGAHPFKEAR